MVMIAYSTRLYTSALTSASTCHGKTATAADSYIIVLLHLRGLYCTSRSVSSSSFRPCAKFYVFWVYKLCVRLARALVWAMSLVLAPVAR